MIDFVAFDPTQGLTPSASGCTNRLVTNFPPNSSFFDNSFWHSAPSAAQVRNAPKGVVPALGTTTYLAYPPPGNSSLSLFFFFDIKLFFGTGNTWSLYPVRYPNNSIVPNQVLYNASLGFSQLLGCGVSTQTTTQNLNINGKLYISLVAPLSPGTNDNYKVAVKNQFILPFQFSVASQQQLLAGITSQSGAQIDVIFLGQTPAGGVDLKIRTVVLSYDQ